MYTQPIILRQYVKFVAKIKNDINIDKYWGLLPSPVAPPPPLGVISSRLNFASRALSKPKWSAVALFLRASHLKYTAQVLIYLHFLIKLHLVTLFYTAQHTF